MREIKTQAQARHEEWLSLADTIKQSLDKELAEIDEALAFKGNSDLTATIGSLAIEQQLTPTFEIAVA